MTTSREAGRRCEELLLDHTRVDDRGLAPLGRMPRLRRISLAGTQVTDAGTDGPRRSRRSAIGAAGRDRGDGSRRRAPGAPPPPRRAVVGRHARRRRSAAPPRQDEVAQAVVAGRDPFASRRNRQLEASAAGHRDSALSVARAGGWQLRLHRRLNLPLDSATGKHRCYREYRLTQSPLPGGAEADAGTNSPIAVSQIPDPALRVSRVAAARPMI